ncbi:hypothetical protein ACFLZQ_02300 [Thermodesulfobacteriota bacterium]
MKFFKRTIFYFLYYVAFGFIFLGALEIASSVFLEKQISHTLTIFTGILQGKQNILDINPFYDKEIIDEEFNVLVHTNSQGYRENFEFDDSQVDIGFMGDSFTFGEGVDVRNRYSNVAARQHPEMTIVSLSYNNGFQPEHYEYFLYQHPDLRPSILFVAIYLGNDLDSDLNETLIKRDNHGKITELALPYRDVFKGALRNKITYRYDWFSRAVEATNLGKLVARKINSSYRLRRKFFAKQNVLPNTLNRLSTELGNLDQHNLRAIIALKNIARTIESRNGELHVLVIPQNFLLGTVQNPHSAYKNRLKIDELRSKNGLMKAVLALCENEGLMCHDLSRILTTDDFFEMNAHWNKNGHKKVGQFVSDIIAQHHSLENNTKDVNRLNAQQYAP